MKSFGKRTLKVAQYPTVPHSAYNNLDTKQHMRMLFCTYTYALAEFSLSFEALKLNDIK